MTAFAVSPTSFTRAKAKKAETEAAKTCMAGRVDPEPLLGNFGPGQEPNSRPPGCFDLSLRCQPSCEANEPGRSEEKTLWKLLCDNACPRLCICQAQKRQGKATVSTRRALSEHIVQCLSHSLLLPKVSRLCSPNQPLLFLLVPFGRRRPSSASGSRRWPRYPQRGHQKGPLLTTSACFF